MISEFLFNLLRELFSLPFPNKLVLDRNLGRQKVPGLQKSIPKPWVGGLSEQ